MWYKYIIKKFYRLVKYHNISRINLLIKNFALFGFWIFLIFLSFIAFSQENEKQEDEDMATLKVLLESELPKIPRGLLEENRDYNMTELQEIAQEESKEKIAQEDEVNEEENDFAEEEEPNLPDGLLAPNTNKGEQASATQATKNKPKPKPVPEQEKLVEKYLFSLDDAHFEAPILTNTKSRMFNFSIPAPRGQITDRYGRPLAQNFIAYYPGIKFDHTTELSRDEVIKFAEAKLFELNKLLNRDYTIAYDKIPQEQIWNFYENRKWLTMPLHGLLSQEQARKIAQLQSDTIKLHPVYIRRYPEKKLASHIIGYVGKVAPLNKGEIISGEPLWELTEGREGIEKSMDKYLTGRDGRLQVIYDDDKKELLTFVNNAAVPGKNVVLTLDLDMQEIAEDLLRKRTKRSAFVLMDVHKGEILAMASYPGFDPNEFVPFISETKYKELEENKDHPLFPRAFRGNYPPASTFKVITAMAALQRGRVSEYTSIGCPSYRMIGGIKFRNWNKNSEGIMTIANAIKRSCNTWFFEAAIRTGSTMVVNVAQNFGFGHKTGISIFDETSGFMPTNQYYKNKFGHRILHGNLVNISIGQGEVLASPLQVARMMAGIAQQQFLPPAILVKQIQDVNNNVVKQYDNKPLIPIDVDKHYIKIIHKGMYLVANGGGGTGRRARNSYGTLAGKTGTGEWKVKIKQNIAWFAGFIPYNKPQYSFALLYEGEPGERVSGGKKAAPIVASFFNKLNELKYKRKKELEEDDIDNMSLYAKNNIQDPLKQDNKMSTPAQTTNSSSSDSQKSNDYSRNRNNDKKETYRAKPMNQRSETKKPATQQRGIMKKIKKFFWFRY